MTFFVNPATIAAAAKMAGTLFGGASAAAGGASGAGAAGGGGLFSLGGLGSTGGGLAMGNTPGLEMNAGWTPSLWEPDILQNGYQPPAPQPPQPPAKPKTIAPYPDVSGFASSSTEPDALPDPMQTIGGIRSLFKDPNRERNEDPHREVVEGAILQYLRNMGAL